MVVLNNKVLILPDKPKEFTEGGIAVPETAQDKPRSGIVILTNDESLKGCRVHYASYAGVEIKLKLDNNKEEIYHILSEKELWLKE